MNADAKANIQSRTKLVSPRKRIDTCARRIVNKAPSPPSLPISGHTDIWPILSRVYPQKWGKDTGRFRGATIRGGKSRSRRARWFRGSTTRFRISAICSRAYVPTRCPTSYGYIGARSTGWCIAHGFHPRENPLPSATRPCCGRRSCPASRCPVFGYGTDCSHTLWENQSEVGPLLYFLYVASLTFPFPWPDPRRHINYPANGRSFGIIRNLIRGYTPRRAHARVYAFICAGRFANINIKCCENKFFIL